VSLATDNFAAPDVGPGVGFFVVFGFFVVVFGGFVGDGPVPFFG
jgi:hypothetical protein